MNKRQIFTIVGGAILFGGGLFSGPPGEAQEVVAPVSAAAAAGAGPAQHPPGRLSRA